MCALICCGTPAVSPLEREAQCCCCILGNSTSLSQFHNLPVGLGEPPYLAVWLYVNPSGSIRVAIAARNISLVMHHKGIALVTFCCAGHLFFFFLQFFASAVSRPLAYRWHRHRHSLSIESGHLVSAKVAVPQWSQPHSEVLFCCSCNWCL